MSTICQHHRCLAIYIIRLHTDWANTISRTIILLFFVLLRRSMTVRLMIIMVRRILSTLLLHIWATPGSHKNNIIIIVCRNKDSNLWWLKRKILLEGLDRNTFQILNYLLISLYVNQICWESFWIVAFSGDAKRHSWLNSLLITW